MIIRIDHRTLALGLSFNHLQHMKVTSNASIQSLHTFGFDLSANFLVSIDRVEDLHSIFTNLSFKDMLSTPEGWMVLGAGSNMLFSRDYPGTILQMAIPGVQLVKEDDQYAYVEAGAGEDWHSFVRHTLNSGWYGLENLSLIPGTVGAAPVQNIGAYGVEAEQFIVAVKVFDVIELREKSISHFECFFNYRDSIFKHIGRSRFIITHVLFKLQKIFKPQLTYAPLMKWFENFGNLSVSPLALSDAVMEIRRSKLPDPRLIGNAGSFFKNPIISNSDFETIKSDHPTIPVYQFDGQIKLSAGWMIEQCGWKGYREGSVGCYDKQALVLVHYGGGKPDDLILLARKIRQSVHDRFSILLEAEVNIIGETL
jgi:UDP-N-acetylmuramate dehydrogenase